jgi:outer membrane immunogenic protein
MRHLLAPTFRTRAFIASSVALVALAASTAADAADMPVKYKAPPPVVLSWTGCYVGAHVGGGWIRDEETNVGTINSANFPFGTVRVNSGSGAIGGVQAGCNYQVVPAWLVGVEGDFAWTGIRETSDTFGVVNPAVVNHVDAKVKWLSDIALRVGFIAGERLLIYGKGGAAWMRDDGTSVTTGAGGVVDTIVTRSSTRLGFMVGVGGEYMFAPNWTAKIEYDYFDFGKQTLSSFVAFGANAPVVTGVTLLRDHDTQVHTLKVGINYLFGAAPVVARY